MSIDNLSFHKEEILSSIFKLRNNTTESRNNIYEKYISNIISKYDPPLIEKDSNSVRRQLETLCDSIEYKITEKSQTPLIYIAGALSLTISGAISQVSDVVSLLGLGAIWAFGIVGATLLLFGGISGFGPKHPKRTTIGRAAFLLGVPVTFAFVIGAFVPIESFATVLRPDDAVAPKLDDPSTDVETNPPNELAEVITPLSLQNDYCTILIKSGRSARVDHNVFSNDEEMREILTIEQVRFKSISIKKISDGPNKIEGDFGSFTIFPNGDYSYETIGGAEPGRFEVFTIDLVSEIGQKISEDVFISMIGTDLVGTASQDTIYGDIDLIGTPDTISGRNAGDWLYGKAGDDTIFGEDGQDYINGGTENDTISGDAGNDDLIGQEGNDTISGGDGNDNIYGDEGTAATYGGDDQLYGNAGGDYIFAGRGDDLLDGEAGKDALYGWEGNDTIFGGSEDDDLIGGVGNDSLTGGSGADVFRYYGSDGGDIIHDFNIADGDRLELTKLGESFRRNSQNSEGKALYAVRSGIDTLIYANNEPNGGSIDVSQLLVTLEGVSTSIEELKAQGSLVLTSVADH